MSEREGWVATARLRFVERPLPETMVEGVRTLHVARILQQWFAPELPRYMRGSEGEWRDVELERET